MKLPNGFTPFLGNYSLSHSSLELHAPPTIESAVSQYFTVLNSQRVRQGLSPFSNGDIIMVHERDMHVSTDHTSIELTTSIGKYAQFLYLKDNPDDHKHFPVYSLNPISLMQTREGVYVFGQMSHNTARPGQILCVGSALQPTDIVEQNGGVSLDVTGNLERAMYDEFGIESHRIGEQKPIGLYNYYDSFGISLVYHSKIDATMNDVFDMIEACHEDCAYVGTSPQIVDVVFIAPDARALEQFENAEPCRIEYIVPLMEHVMRNKP